MASLDEYKKQLVEATAVLKVAKVVAIHTNKWGGRHRYQLEALCGQLQDALRDYEKKYSLGEE